jgi:hypothetical protein
MIGLRRYGYTDIVAVTSYFRDKLGQGGYGSVYKIIITPGLMKTDVMGLYLTSVIIFKSILRKSFELSSVTVDHID